MEHVRDCLRAADLMLDAQQRASLDRLKPQELPSRERPAAWETRPPLSGGEGVAIDICKGDGGFQVLPEKGS
jgi:hypothetical protein